MAKEIFNHEILPEVEEADYHEFGKPERKLGDDSSQRSGRIEEYDTVLNKSVICIERKHQENVPGTNGSQKLMRFY